MPDAQSPGLPESSVPVSTQAPASADALARIVGELLYLRCGEEWRVVPELTVVPEREELVPREQARSPAGGASALRQERSLALESGGAIIFRPMEIAYKVGEQQAKRPINKKLGEEERGLLPVIPASPLLELSFESEDRPPPPLRAKLQAWAPLSVLMRADVFEIWSGGERLLQHALRDGVCARHQASFFETEVILQSWYDDCEMADSGGDEHLLHRWRWETELVLVETRVSEQYWSSKDGYSSMRLKESVALGAQARLLGEYLGEEISVNYLFDFADPEAACTYDIEEGRARWELEDEGGGEASSLLSTGELTVTSECSVEEMLGELDTNRRGDRAVVISAAILQQQPSQLEALRTQAREAHATGRIWLAREAAQRLRGLAEASGDEALRREAEELLDALEAAR